MHLNEFHKKQQDKAKAAITNQPPMSEREFVEQYSRLNPGWPKPERKNPGNER